MFRADAGLGYRTCSDPHTNVSLGRLRYTRAIVEVLSALASKLRDGLLGGLSEVSFGRFDPLGAIGDDDLRAFVSERTNGPRTVEEVLERRRQQRDAVVKKSATESWFLPTGVFWGVVALFSWSILSWRWALIPAVLVVYMLASAYAARWMRSCVHEREARRVADIEALLEAVDG